MLRCIAVDDEAYATRILAAYIEKVPFLTLAGTTTKPLEALMWVQEGRADVVFLDIQMPELTGLQFLKLCGPKCKVILTTAYPEYALEGYEHDVVDYLLKPIAFDRFLRAAQKAYALLTPPAGASAAPALAAPPVSLPPSPNYMFVKGESKNKFQRVAHADILYIEGLKNYVSIYLPGQRLVTYQSLRELETQLPQPPFLRVHKSYIVSLNYLRLIDDNTLTIGQETIVVGETYREAFFKIIRER
ncbi:LytR/AlgR family response regulator transcription factor [uncultured Hymenobacter sp.]|uniref:LytR/AlgR family response regulator transcription factor n=1 Tax=uncultured Hymenobacter sp. TaxID=170016 RepID=UPI0035CAA5F1